MGILKAGRAYVPLDTKAQPQIVRHVLSTAKPAAVFVDTKCEIAEEIRNSGTLVVDVSDIWESLEKQPKHQYEFPPRVSAPSREIAAAILFTSGSTGLPKGVILSHATVLHRLTWQWDAFPFSPSDTCCFKTALTFVDSIAEIFAPLLKGIRIIVFPKCDITDPNKLLHQLESHHISRLVLVPSLLRTLLSHISHSRQMTANAFIWSLESLRLWVCSGETLSAHLGGAFFDAFRGTEKTLCNFYGSTEVMGDILYDTFSSAPDLRSKLFQGKVPLGKPIAKAQIRLLVNDGTTPASEEEPGEICASGPSVASGYVNVPDCEAFSTAKDGSRMFRSGDLAVLVQGRFYFLGRKDSLVKIRGKKVSLEAIEAEVLGVDGVQRAVAVCKKNELGVFQGLVVFFTTADNRVSEETVGEYLTFSSLDVVPQLVKLPQFPLLPNGKPDRTSLKKILDTQISSATEDKIAVIESFKEFCSAKQAEILVKAVDSVLGVSAAAKAFASAKYADLGGDSLNAVFFVNEVQRTSALNLVLKDFLKCETMAEIAILLEKSFRPFEKIQLPMSETLRIEIIPLQEHHLTDQNLYRVGVESYSKKGFVEQTLPHLAPTLPEFEHYLKAALNNDDLSLLAVKHGSREILGVSLNVDINKPIDLRTSGERIPHYTEFTLWLKDTFWSNSPKEPGKVFMNLWEAVDPELDSVAAVEVMHELEVAALELAEKKRFRFCCAANVHPVAQQISRDLGYEIKGKWPMEDYVNKYGERVYENMGVDGFNKEIAVKQISTFFLPDDAEDSRSG